MQRSYFSSSITCFRILLSNLSLLLPDALLIALTSLLFFAVLYVNGLHALFILAETEFQDILRALLVDTSRLVQLIVTSLVALALNVFVGLTLVAARLEMVQSVIAKKPISFFAAFRKGRALLWRLFGVKFFVALLYAFVGLIFIGLFFRFFGSGSDSTLPSFAILIFIFVALAFFLLFKLLFLFVYPHLIYQKKGIIATLRATYAYALSRKYHVFFVGLTILLINLCAQLILSLLSSLVASIPFLVSFFGLLGLVIALFLTVWNVLYIFVNYSLKV